MLQRPLHKAKRSLVRKAKQPLVDKFKNPFQKFRLRQDIPESKTRKIYQSIPFWKLLFINREFESGSGYNNSKEPLSRRAMRFHIGSRKEIHYRNIDSIGRFIGLGGRIIPRRVTKLTLRHQRLMTKAIKNARFIALLPFIENELHFEKKWRDILARRRKKKDKKKNRNKGRSIPKPELITLWTWRTQTSETAPKTEPRVPKGGANPWTRPFEGLKTNPQGQPEPGVGRESRWTRKTAPKTEPRVPSFGTETAPKTEPRVPGKKPPTSPEPGVGERWRWTRKTAPKTEPRVPSFGTETAPKTEPRVPGKKPPTSPEPGVGGTGTQETAPKTEPRVPKGGTKPGTSPRFGSSYRNRTRD